MGSGGWGELVFLDGVVEGGGLGQGGYAEFGFEDVEAVAVLVEGGGAVSGPGVKLHDLLVGGFVQGVEGEPAVGVGEGAVVLLLLAVAVDELFEGAAELVLPMFGLLPLPVVEGEAVAEGEAGEEGGAVEGNGRFELRSRGAGQQGSRGEQLLELEYVAPDLIGVEADLVAADEEGGIADAAFEGGEGAAEGGFGVAVVVVGPEEGGKGFAGVGLAGEGEVGEQGDGFAGVGLDGLPVVFEPG